MDLRSRDAANWEAKKPQLPLFSELSLFPSLLILHVRNFVHFKCVLEC